MSLSCALLATSLHQWARRYIRLTQPARCSPEKRARMRAFFANGVEKMHVPWAVEALPTLLHLSLFLFFGGLAIFLFHIDHEVVSYVIWWIGLFSMVYGLITLLPIIRHDSPYSSPLSTPAWFLYASIHHVTFQILALITPGEFWSYRARRRCKHSRDRYQGWMLGGVEKAAEETVSERSSEIDVQILDWTISALGDDDSLKSFCEEIPGFFNSKLVKHLKSDFPEELLQKFRDALSGFLGRTWSSNAIDDSEKLGRLDISMNTMNQFGVSHVWFILHKIFFDDWDEIPQTVEMGQTLARWCTSGDQSVAQYSQVIIARILGGVRERDDSWITLAARITGLSEHDLRDNITDGIDSVLLAILIQVIHPTIHSVGVNLGVLQALSKLDIRNTLPRLQSDFCTLWNKLAQEARKQGPYTTPVNILRCVRHLYITSHQDTDAAVTAFTSSTGWHDEILYKPSSYPFCNLTSHHPDSVAQIPVPNSHLVPLTTLPGNSPNGLPHSPTDGSATVRQQVKQTNIIAGLPELPASNPTTTSEIGKTPQGLNTIRLTTPALSSPYSTVGSPTGDVAATVATTTQTITSTVTWPHPQEGNKHQDAVAQCAEPDTSQALSTASTQIPTPVPVSTSTPPLC